MPVQLHEIEEVKVRSAIKAGSGMSVIYYYVGQTFHPPFPAPILSEIKECMRNPMRGTVEVTRLKNQDSVQEEESTEPEAVEPEPVVKKVRPKRTLRKR